MKESHYFNNLLQIMIIKHTNLIVTQVPVAARREGITDYYIQKERPNKCHSSSMA